MFNKERSSSEVIPEESRITEDSPNKIKFKQTCTEDNNSFGKYCYYYLKTH